MGGQSDIHVHSRYACHLCIRLCSGVIYVFLNMYAMIATCWTLLCSTTIRNVDSPLQSAVLIYVQISSLISTHPLQFHTHTLPRPQTQRRCLLRPPNNILHPLPLGNTYR